MLLKNNVKLAGRIPNFCNFIIIERQFSQTNALWENRENENLKFSNGGPSL